MRLEDLRVNIDEIDNLLLELLNQRMEVVKKVGELKKVEKYKKWMDATRTMNNKRIAIWKQLEIERFLLSIINDPNAFDVFLDNLILNSGRLLAVFILNNPTNENRLKAKEIIVDYINAQIANSISY